MSIQIDRITDCGFPPGAVGAITALHATYYAEVWGFDIRFEAEVARELGDFALAFDPARDGLWLAKNRDEIVGSLIIDRQNLSTVDNRLRWFILASDCQGAGIGRRMLAEAVAFSRERGDARLFLKTFAGLDAARKLYEDAGFVLIGEDPDTDWNEAGIVHQTFQITFA